MLAILLLCLNCHATPARICSQPRIHKLVVQCDAAPPRICYPLQLEGDWTRGTSWHTTGFSKWYVNFFERPRCGNL